MKKILSIALIFSLGFATTRVVCTHLTQLMLGGRCWCDILNSNAYDSLSAALKDSSSGDEIKICSGNYNESDLNITQSNLYIHSYNYDPSAVTIYDNSNYPIFNIKNSGLKLEALTIEQDSNQVDINVSAYVNDNSSNGIVKNLVFKDLIVNSNGKGILLKYNVNNVFDDVNITSSDVSLKSDWSEFYGVKISNSEFNQTSSNNYAFMTYATNFKDNNFDSNF